MENNVKKLPFILVYILLSLTPEIANCQYAINRPNGLFKESYVDSLLYERINDLRQKNKKKKLPHSFKIRKYISMKNSIQLKQKNSCFHPDWTLYNEANKKNTAYIFDEFKSFYNFKSGLPKNLHCSFIYTEVAAATWGFEFDNYNDLATYFAQMWWDSDGHKAILYDANYYDNPGVYYMLGVSIKKDGDNYYGIANVIGFMNLN